MHSDTLEGFRLSPQQRHLWSLQRSVENQPYLVQCLLSLEGPLDSATLQKALRSVVLRHEILHTSFRCLPGITTPLQFIADERSFSLSVYDFSTLEALEREPAIETLVLEARSRLLDFEAGPLFSACLLVLEPRRHLLLLTAAALCADVPTLKNLIEEMCRCYAARSGDEDCLAEPMQYADLSEWQNELLQEEDAEVELAYWRKLDRSRLTAMHVPFGQGLEKQPDLQQGKEFTPQTLTIPLEAACFSPLTALAQQCNSSLATLLLTCWQALLSRFTGMPDLVIGVLCDGRHYEQLATALGPYARVIPLNVELTAGCPFREAVTQVESSLAQAVERQEYFTWEERDEQGESFIPLAFGFEDWPTWSAGGEMRLAIQHSYSCLDRFVLKLAALQTEAGLSLTLHYDPAYLSVEQVRYLGDCLLSLLRDALARPQASVDALELLDPREQQRLLQTHAQTRTSYSRQGLQHLFEAQAAQRGRELAAICGQELLTYEQLNIRANQLAHYLRDQGVAPNVLVALCLPRSLDLLVALLAVLKAGGTYVPFDPDYPSARLCWQLQDLAPHILLTHESLLPQFVEWRGPTLCLDLALLDEWPQHNPQVAFSPDDLAYVIYTSGSTGTPKGVMIPHRAVSNYTQALCEQLAVEAGWHFATVSTLAADLGNTAIFCSLASGGCLHILPYEVLTSAPALERYVQKYPLDVLKIVPSHLSALLRQGEEQHLLPRRFLLLGGEALPGSLLFRLAQAGSRCCILNHYGPTEATIGAVTNMLGEASTAALTAHTDVVPIGRSIPNMEAYILDKDQHLVPVGVVGEIYLAGSGLALGYLKSAAQTAERFVPHSFSQEPGQRMYRTGDLARYREEGVIEFVGRKDEQVKLRGYRIELKEIEAALKLHPAIEEAVVLLQERTPEDKQLVAYMVPEKHEYKPIVETEIREFLKEQLPMYMVPAEMRLLERLPLTANGKVDRAHLPTSAPLIQEQAGKPEEARTPLEEVMAGVWQEVLNVKLVGRNDNFFHLGGHSLLGMKLVSRLRAVFGVEVPITWVFEAPTVAQLAARMDDLLRGPELPSIPPLVPVSRQEDLPLSFAQQRLWFLDQLEPGSTAYLMPGVLYLRSALNVAALESSLKEMMRRHESLRTTFQMRNNQPVQVISSTIKLHQLLIDLCDLSVEERLAVARIVAEQERQQPFDLARGPLLRVRVLRLNVEEHVLLSTMHHIISDGWSNEIFVRELTLLYRSFAAGLPPSLPPLPIQYADFAVWQRAWLQGEVLEKQLDYWISQLGGASTLELRTDHPHPAMPSRRSAVQRFRLPAELSRALAALSGQEGVTLFMTLLAAFQVLLYRYTGQEDILVGTDSANRSRLETENIIGFFVNLLVLRTDLSGKPSFQEVLRRVREVVLGAYAHQDTPFELLVEKLVSDHRPDRMPLVQVLFVLQNIPATHEQSVEAGLPPTREELIEATPASLKFSETRTAKFDLALFMHERSEQLHGSLIYSQDLFEANTIATMIARFEVLLQSIVKHPDIAVDRLEFIAENEQVAQKNEEQALLHALRKQDGEWFDLSEIDFA